MATLDETYKYLKLSGKKERVESDGYTWESVGKIVKVDSRNYRGGITGIYRKNKVLVDATEEEFNAQNI